MSGRDHSLLVSAESCPEAEADYERVEMTLAGVSVST